VSDPACEVCGADVADRFFCDDCPDEVANDYRPRRCYACHIAHGQTVHGKIPEPKQCPGCGKELGLVPPAFSKAGAPWCGVCPPWWF
jgi:hypothetical protein